MKRIPVSLLIIFAFFALSACGRNSDNEPASADEAVGNVSQANSDQPASNPDSVSALARSYEGALPPTNQLILGILELEDTDDAVTAAQASTMLPLWQALQSGTIQNQSERAAVLRQIEGTLTDTQINAIGTMQLTFTDMSEWAQENGLELPQFGPGGGQGQGQGQGGPGGLGGAFADMSQEERAAFREEMQNLSPEERQERLREMGVEIPEGGFRGQRGGQGPAGGGGRLALLLTPLIELLQSKATL
ncbi:MAG: hypothetical protein OXF86_21010 [Caldilineaceae bacterium]|nr:hypothetical protein [Caldilineaceae bacterium]